MDTVNRILGKFPAQSPLDIPEEAEPVESHGCVGFLRGVRDRATMLELRQRNGNILAVAYAWLDRAEFDPSTGITLHLGGREISISGRNLGAELVANVTLFSAITRHRCLWVREAEPREGLAGDIKGCVIERIHW